MGDIQKFNPREAEPAATAAHTPMAMVQEAVKRNASIEVIEKLLGLHERFEASQARRAFDAAMAGAKAEIPIINKNRHVGFKSKDSNKSSTDYDHEDLAEVVRIVAPILGKYGLSHRYRVKQTPQQITVICVIAHRDGHFEETELFAGPDTTGNKNAIQAIGSTITFLQRYLLKSALGLAASKDDDGRSTQAAPAAPQKISEAQLDELMALADETNACKIKICRHFQIECMPDLPVSRLAEAMSIFEARRKMAVANA